MDIKETLVVLVHNARMNALWHNAQNPDEYITDMLMEDGVTVQEWIPSSEHPTRKDADKYCRVLAMEMGMIELVNYKGPINYPDRFPYWMPLPKPPKGE